MSLFLTPKTGEVWQFSFQLKGQKYQGSTRETSRRRAEAVERQRRAAAEEAQRQGGVGRGNMLLGEACVEYIQKVLDGYTPRNALDQQRNLQWLEDHLGAATPIAAIDTARISDLVFERRQERARARGVKQERCVAEATVNRTVTQPLRRLLNFARDMGAQVANIAWGRVIFKEKEEHPREVEAHEEAMLASALPADYDRVMRFARVSGLRLTECLLRWDQIANGQLTVVGKGGDIIVKRISSAMQAVLDEARQAQAAAPTTHVFTLSYGGVIQPLKAGTLKSAWTRAKRAGRIPANLRFHDLRHDHVTKMLRLVQNPRTVQRAMGHKKLETTMRYAHVLKSESDAAIELIGQHLHQAETERRQASLRVVGGVS